MEQVRGNEACVTESAWAPTDYTGSMGSFVDMQSEDNIETYTFMCRPSFRNFLRGGGEMSVHE